MSTSEHIVKSFDGDLKRLHDEIETMGHLVVAQIEQAGKAVENMDVALAREVIEKDPKIDAIDQEIDSFAIRTIALRQPVAQDLRTVIAALKVAGHLERIADYATNVAKRVLSLADANKMPSMGRAVNRQIHHAKNMIADVLAAYITLDDAKATEVWTRDAELDEMYMGFMRELLTYMMEDPRNISACSQMLFVAKNIERIGDHATNIAEIVHYLVSGQMYKTPRPKGEGEQKMFAIDNNL